MGNFDFESGRRLLREGELVEAIRCFLSSLDLDPGHVGTYVELFSAYEQAWQESGDPLVLDQMRKVAVAGLKRGPGAAQRAFLEEGLDRVEALILEVQAAEEESVATVAPVAEEEPAAAPLLLLAIRPKKERS